MKTINFMKSLGPREQLALARWYTISIFLVSTTLIVLVSLQMYQLFIWYTLKAQQTSIRSQSAKATELTTHYEQLKEKEANLHCKQATIKELTRTQHMLPTYLTTLVNTLGSTRILESLTINATDIQLKILCLNTQAALETVQKLQSVPHYANLQLQELHPTTTLAGKRIAATITGTFKI